MRYILALLVCLCLGCSTDYDPILEQQYNYRVDYLDTAGNSYRTTYCDSFAPTPCGLMLWTRDEIRFVKNDSLIVIPLGFSFPEGSDKIIAGGVVEAAKP